MFSGQKENWGKTKHECPIHLHALLEQGVYSADIQRCGKFVPTSNTVALS